MSEIHNLQVIISQMPNVNKVAERLDNQVANGAQIINVVNLEKDNQKTTQVSQLTEPLASQRENRERTKGKKTPQEEKERSRGKKRNLKKGRVDIYG